MKVVGTNERAGAKAVKRPVYATANRRAAVRLCEGAKAAAGRGRRSAARLSMSSCPPVPVAPAMTGKLARMRLKAAAPNKAAPFCRCRFDGKAEAAMAHVGNAALYPAWLRSRSPEALSNT